MQKLRYFKALNRRIVDRAQENLEYQKSPKFSIGFSLKVKIFILRYKIKNL